MGLLDQIYMAPGFYTSPYSRQAANAVIRDPSVPIPPSRVGPEDYAGLVATQPPPKDMDEAMTRMGIPPSARPKTGGILGVLKNILMPEAGTFWASAMKHGLLDARTGMVDDANDQRKLDDEHALSEAQAGYYNSKATPDDSGVEVVGNHVFDKKTRQFLPDPPSPPSDTMQLLQIAVSDPDPVRRQAAMRKFLGASDPNLIEYKERTKAKYRAPPRPRASDIPPPPPGAKIISR